VRNRCGDPRHVQTIGLATFLGLSACVGVGDPEGWGIGDAGVPGGDGVGSSDTDTATGSGSIDEDDTDEVTTESTDDGLVDTDTGDSTGADVTSEGVESTSSPTSEGVTTEAPTDAGFTTVSDPGITSSDSGAGGLLDGELCSGPADCASGFCYRSPYYDDRRCQPACIAGEALDNNPVMYCEGFDVNCCGAMTCDGTYCYL
jgi:hypothetical protein